MTNEPQPKIKMLIHSEFFCNTGFSKVAENIVRELLKTKKYDITVIGANFFGEPYDHEKWPITVYPAFYFTKQHIPQYDDVMGKQRVIDELAKGIYDVLFTVYDPGNMVQMGEHIDKMRSMLKEQNMKPFKWVFYFPTESYIREHWVQQALSKADFPVAYTKYGQNEVMKADPNIKPDIIYHGTNFQDFHILKEEEIKEAKTKIFSGFFKDKFVVTNINRNVPRKDISRTLRVFKEFKKQVPNAILYLHCRPDDLGGDFRVMAKDLGMEEWKDYVWPANMTLEGYPVEVINVIYNVSDMIISTTLAEGWGLSITEAMATKKPFVFPNHTSLTEIAADGRGILCETNDLTNFGQVDWNIFREVTDLDDMVDKMVKLHDQIIKKDPSITEMVEKAYKWVNELSWENVCKEWDKLFTKASIDYSKAKRNDDCPCGSGKKYKHCCLK